MRSIYSYEPAERLKQLYSFEGILDDALFIAFFSSSYVGSKIVITTLTEDVLRIL